MNIDKDKILKEIINLPRTYHDLGDKSIYELLDDTGYFQLHDQISANDIARILKIYPHTIHEWLTWSEDKRVVEGWAFMINKGQYIVEYFSNNKEAVKIKKYPDKIEACAVFIKNEIEDIRKL